MNSYGEALTGGPGKDPAVNKGGKTQPRPSGDKDTNPGGQGAIPAVVGNDSPVVRKGGATNNGGRLPADSKTVGNLVGRGANDDD